MINTPYKGRRVSAAVVIFAEDYGIMAECGDQGTIVSRESKDTCVVKFATGHTFCELWELNPLGHKTFPVPALRG